MSDYISMLVTHGLPKSGLKRKIIIGLMVLLLCALINTFWIQGKNHAIPLTGGCSPQSAQIFKQPFGKNYRVTSCAGQDSEQSGIATDYFSAGAWLRFFYSGYPANEGLDLYLERQDGLRFDLSLENTGERWQVYELAVPEAFREEPVRMVIQDVSTQPDTWAGIGEVGSAWHIHIKIEALLLLIIILAGMHALLVAWLAVALKQFPGESGPAWFLIGLGIAGYLAFWSYYLDRWAGLSLSAIALSSGISAVVWAWRNQCWRYIRTSNRLLLPVSLYTFFILVVCYFPEFDLANISAPASRWMNLPSDNYIPRLFSDQVWAGVVSKPMLETWLSSDRPPLQTGIYLIYYALGNNGVTYQVVASELQALVFIPVFLLVRQMNAKLTPLAAIALGITSLMAVHILFVWPKLIAASYSMIFFMLALTPFGDGLPRRAFAFLLGASVALAMLSHGGAIFGIMAITLLYLLRNKLTAFKDGVCASLVTVLIYSPWAIYQRWIDPPGNRLIKMHLAGMEGPDSLTVSEAIVSAYKGISFQDWINGRFENLKKIFGGAYDFAQDYFAVLSDPINSVLYVKGHGLLFRSFFDTFYSYWWFSPVFALLTWILFKGWRKTISPAVVWLLVSAMLSALISVVLLFLPSATSIHQISYFTWLAFYLGSLVVVGSMSPIIFTLLLVMNAAVFFHFYVYDIVWNNPVDVGMAYLVLTASPYYLFVRFCLSLADIDENYRILPAGTRFSIRSVRNQKI